MVRPRFSFFITQADGTIFGSAVDPQSNEQLAYVIGTDGHVSARRENMWYELPQDEAGFIRVVAGQVYHIAKNYLTKQKIF